MNKHDRNGHPSISFRKQIFVLFTISLLFFSFVGAMAAGWFSSKAMGETLLEQGRQVTTSFARQSILLLLYGDETSIADTSDVLLGFPGVIHLSIFDKDGRQLWEKGEPLAKLPTIEKTSSPFEPVLSQESDKAWTFVAAVYEDVVADEHEESPFELTRPKATHLGYVQVTMDKSRLLAMRKTVFMENIIGIMFFAAVFLWLLLSRTKKLTRPLQDLSALMSRAERGEESVRAKEAGTLEVSQMARAFNTMISSLEDRAARLKAEIGVRKETERKLRDRETHLNAVIENVAEAILIVDDKGDIESINASGHRIFAIKQGESSEVRTFYQLVSNLPVADLSIESLVGKGTLEALGYREEGAESFPLEISISDMEIGGSRKFIVIARDITDRKAQEQEITSLLARLEAILASVPGIIFQLDQAGRLMWWNPVMEELTGHLPETMKGREMSHFLNIPAPDVAEHHLNQVLHEGYAEVEFEFKTKQGLVPYKFHCARIGEAGSRDVSLIGIGIDITTQLEAQKAMQDARDAALESVRVKSEFLANMSHEIRTPLNGLLGMLELLSATPLNEEQKEYARIAMSSGDSLLNIINEVLDFSKLEANQVVLEKTQMGLTALVEEVVGLYVPKAQQKGVSLALYIENDVPEFVEADPFRIRQVLSNLIDNAVKFTDEGEVYLHVRNATPGERGKAITLAFELYDTGIGIDSSDMEKIFSSFVQADGSATRKFGGTGLGLAISRELVSLMGGELTVESTPGRGSMFRFTMRVERGDLAGHQPPFHLSKEIEIVRGPMDERHSEIITAYLQGWGIQAIDYRMMENRSGTGKEIVIIHDDDCSEFAANPPEWLTDAYHIKLVNWGGEGRQSDDGGTTLINKPLKKTDLYNALKRLVRPLDGQKEMANDHTPSETFSASRPLSILLAEDNPNNQHLTLKMLDKMGHQTDVASNGLEVLAALENGHYDLILMDCQMPEVDGYQATHLIRKREDRFKNIIIIAVTGNALAQDREKCFDAGINDFLAKPFRYEELRGIIDKWATSLPMDDVPK